MVQRTGAERSCNTNCNLSSRTKRRATEFTHFSALARFIFVASQSPSPGSVASLVLGMLRKNSSHRRGSVHAGWALQALFKQPPVLGDPSAHTLPPHPETRGFELTAHHIDDLSFSKPGALLYLLEGGAILPSKSNDLGDLLGCAGRFRDLLGSLRWRLIFCQKGKNPAVAKENATSSDGLRSSVK
jgi:hypothetical protein